MWGLIYKDIIVNKKMLLLTAAGSVFITVIFMAAVIISADGDASVLDAASAVSPMIAICAFLPWIDLPTQLIKNDESMAWRSFVTASQVSVRGQVASKYAFGFIVLVLILNFLYFFVIVGDVILYSSAGVTAMAASLNAALLIVFVFLLVWAVEIPFTVYFGSKNGGMIKMIMFYIITLGIIIYGLYGKKELSFDGLFRLLLSDDIGIGAYALMTAFEIGAAVLYYLSYRISCRLYLKGAENNG